MELLIFICLVYAIYKMHIYYNKKRIEHEARELVKLYCIYNKVAPGIHVVKAKIQNGSILTTK